MNYTQISINERICIANCLGSGFSITQIARLLKRSKSTISREITRNSCCEGYHPTKAQEKRNKQKERCGGKRKLVNGSELYNEVVIALKRDWSPEQIVNCLDLNISVSTIYRAFHNRTLSRYAQHFRRLTYNRGWKKGKKRGEGIKGCRKIEERPKEVFNREEFGHWELDTMVFCRKEKKVSAVFVERKTGVVEAVLLENRKAENMKEAIVNVFSKYTQQARKTLTVDRGREFELWREIEKELVGTVIYFCDPMCPHQKGCVENLNGLLRQYYPKKKNTKAPTTEQLSIVQASLNNRPRKRLNYATPNQLFQYELQKCCT